MRPSAARLPAARAVLGCVFVIITLRASAADLDVVVNEVLYHPPPGLEDAEFIELHNRGGDPVDISGWKLSGGAKLTVPSGTTIPAGGYLVLVRDRDLAALLYGGASIVGNYSGRLSRTSGRIRLENRVGVLVDQFDYARSDNWPEDAAGKGASIEKISPELDSWFADSWEASLTLLGSPGKLNTQFHRLVPLEMILPGEEWKYLKGTAEPSAEPGGWAQPAFDDSAWDVGPTGIGYEDGDDATVLDDMVGNYSTVYLRKTFEVADPEKVETLRFVVDYDDGFVLYLNGVEVARRNAGEMPGEPLPYDSLASASREAGTLEEIDLTTDTALLVAGTNALAIHVLNVELDSTDLSMIPALASEVLVSGAETSLNRLVPSTPVPPSSQWLYFEGTEEPSAGPGAWTQLDFGDSLWPEGTAGFGFGDDDDATVLPMQNSYTTVYLRRFFSVPDIQQVRGLTLGVDYDDGFIAYLNGVEVARAGAPGAAGELAPHDAVASLSHEAGTVELFDIAGAIDLLQAGDNVLALQGFNRTIDSSDFSLHPRLTVLTAVEGDPAAVRAGVTVNEIYLPEEETGWIELYNRSSEAADVSGYGISTDPLDPLLHRLPEATILPAGGRLVIQEADLGFTAPASGLLLLTDATGIVLVDGAPYEIRDPALSWGRHPDGEGDIQALAAPTPGEPNEAPPDWGLVINEIMYHPLADPFAEESEWVEIHNASESAVDLTGWAFTGSVAFDLPAAAIIPAGGFVVVARDPAAVEAEYGISGVLGPCGGRLLNDGGTVALRDHLGNVADLVRYASDGRWPAAAGGTGPSAELIHPALDNSSGLAWRASAAAGTPGAANSSFATSAPPIVGSLRHFPLVPDAGQSVTVSLEASGLAPIEEVRIFHRASGAAAFSLDFLRDDGLSGDGEAGDGIFAGALPPQPLGTVVEFYVEVEDAGAMVQVVPPDAPEECNLYLVDGPGERLGAPLYRVIMTPEDRFELESRDVESDVLLNATFVAADRPYYRVGVRYRGRSARFVTPKSYRVEFTRDEDLEGIVHLDLNANRPHHQQLGMRIFRGADVPAPLTRIVRLIFCGDAELTYVRAEDVDEDFLRRTYPEPDGEDGGNLYRGLEDGDLDYRGADEEAYRPSYRKVTNEEQDDWSDLIALCDALANTPDGELETALPLVIDVEEWVRFFAVHTLISTQEEGICRDGGGDYFVYRRPSDGRFVIIPGDLDDSFRVPTERLFRPSLAQIRRILEHPRWAPVYFSHLVDLGGTYLSAERMSDETAALEGLFASSELASVRDFASNRLLFLDTQISREFTVELRPSTLLAEGAEWRFFRGTHEPSSLPMQWAALDFDDSLWESGPSGFGYGDNDDATVLDDMPSFYTTVYARHRFTVEDPEQLAGLELAVDYDDGFIAFLNGVEIARANAGPASTYPDFDSVATDSREAGEAETFKIPGVVSLLQPGDNVLAVVGLNVAIDSTDFSLIPELRTGGVAGEGCEGDYYVTGGRLVLGGKAPVTSTRWVLVDGEEALYDPIGGDWSFETPLGGVQRDLTVQTLAVDGSVSATRQLSVTRVTPLSGSISGERVLTADESPFLVVGSVYVASADRLVIEAGCELYVSPARSFNIQGELQALGTEESGILITRVPCHDNWGTINFQSTRADNRMEHVELSHSTAESGCLTVRGSRLEVEGCYVHDIDGEGINASSSTINIRDSLFERTHEVLSLDFCVTRVEFNTVRSGQGKADLVDANGANNPPAYIAFNTLYGTSDDGIDADRGSVTAEANIIRSCGDQAISLVGAGHSTVYRNIMYRNTVGLSVKDSHVCDAMFNTIAYNTSIGARGIEKNAGLGGGIINIRDSIIWGNPTPLFVNSTGVITATYCDIDGAEPVPGEGNIQADPLFVSASTHDYRLQAASPCIGAASDGDDMGALPYEITPRAPADLRVVSSTANSVSLAWTDRSFAEEGFEFERRSSIGFTPEILITAGDAWRFFRGTQEPSAGTLGWAGVEFDDSAWEEGPSGFGYGDGDDATVLADMQNHYSTIYLRRTFDIEDAALFTGLKLLVDYDDGFVAYLNGVEVARMQAGLPGTFLPFDSLASDQHEAGEAVSVEFPVAGILRSGVNALAIQGLNINLSSTDFSLIPRLETVDETPFSLYAVLPADNRAFSDADLEPDTLYSYRVRAFNSEGTSAYSNIATLETAGVPSAPTDLRVVSVGDTSIGLEWTDTSDSESGFELERAAAEEEFERIAEIVADQTSYTDEGLASGETYSYRIRAVNIFGRSAFSNTVTQTTGSPPAAPSDLAIQEVFLDALRVVWVDNSEDETGFELQIRVGSAASFQQRAILLPDTTEYLDAELQPGETYAYRVRALGEAGNSDWSNEAAGETGTLPPAPADLTVSAVGLDSIALSWMSAAAAAQSLELERKGPGDESFLLLITLPPDATSHVDAALASGSTYAYRLRALNAFGSSPYSEVAEATTGRLPAQPSALSVVSFGLDWVEIGWLDNADNETGFELERSDAGGPFALAVLLSEGSTGVVDTGLAAGTHYAYRLRAVNAYGPSAYSEAVEVTTGRLPAAPAGLQVLELGYNSVTLGWTDLSDNETGFAIERSEDGSTFTPAGQVSRDATIFSDVGLAQDTEYFYRVFATGEFGRSEGWAEIAVRTGRLPLAPSGLAAAAIGLDSVTIVWTDNSDNELRFDIYRKNAGGVFALVGHAGADTAVYEDTGLQPGTGYVYRIAAVGQFGPSDPSEELAVTTGRLPAAPVDLRATAIGLDYIELEWTDAADNETGFEIERRTAGGVFAVIATPAADATRWTDDGLLPGTVYDYRIFAAGAYGRSETCAELTAATGRLPAAPADLAVESVTSGEVVLRWSDIADNETGYEVERRASAETGFERIAELEADAERYADRTVAPGTTYEYRVRAVGELGASAYSAEVSATPGYPPPLLTSIEPAEGPAAGGTEVVIRGEEFTAGSAVSIGGRAIQYILVESATEIRGLTPAGERGAVDVTVATEGGEAALEAAFRYFDSYRRGDATTEGDLDLSDAISILRYLFLGGAPPPCEDVADANSDADVDVSDAVYVLNYLFMGGDPIDPVDARCY